MKKLTLAQQKHLKKIQDHFFILTNEKYRRGAAEHGGNLTDKSPLELLNDALDECVDQFTYLSTLKDKLLHTILTDESHNQ